MPNTPFKKIEALYLRTEKLLKELITYVEFERDSLVKNDLKNLIFIVENKQKIIMAVEDTVENIINISRTTCPKNALSVRDRQYLEKLSKRIAELKQEVRTKGSENIFYIQEAMNFLNELILMFITGGGDVDCYGPVKKEPKRRLNLMYEEEV